VSEWLNIKNPDEIHRKVVIRQLKANDGYCPSKSERSEDTKCHCKEYREQGVCKCGLYLKIPVVDVTPA